MSSPPVSPSKSSSHHHDEYTDYSCSTSTERLARDVETILRSWHVDKGNDRHISIRQRANGGAASCATTVWSSNSAAASSSLLLRSDTVAWNASLRTGPRLLQFTVELRLALWDAPPNTTAGTGNAVATAAGSSDYSSNHKCAPPPAQPEDDGSLPHSLRRTAHSWDLPGQRLWMDNFSYLFGIGQHITLTPVVDSTNSTNSTQSLLLEGDLQYLAQEILQRHDDVKTARWILHQTLSGWLQTALNCAVANCQCCLPVFGVWGSYQPDLCNHTQQQQQWLQLYPQWMRGSKAWDLPPPKRPFSRKQYWEWEALKNNRYLPPILSGTVLPTLHTSANFWCSVLPGRLPSTESRLTLWGSVLLQHCPDDTVVLWNARHVYGWWKQPLPEQSALQRLLQPDDYRADIHHRNNPFTAWRQQPQQQQHKSRHQLNQSTTNTTIHNNEETGVPQVIDLTLDEGGDESDDYDYDEKDYQGAHAVVPHRTRWERYQDKCRHYATNLLERALGASPSEPLWGPVEDPVASILATVTWNGAPPVAEGDDNATTASSSSPLQHSASGPPPRQPLLSFPLRIRSRHSMSHEDWLEMEESVERTILDPLVNSSQFVIQAQYDLDTPIASLAATQHCLLAALIRVSTLPDETLLKHITDPSVLEQWDTESGNVVAASLASQAKVGPTTRALVDAMDWATLADDMMYERDADNLLQDLLSSGSARRGKSNDSNRSVEFPVPPREWMQAQTNGTGPPILSGGRNSSFTPLKPIVLASPTTVTSSPGLYFGAKDAPLSPMVVSKRAVQNSAVPVTEDMFDPLFKSAPTGRLLSLLCMHMSRLRSPCSMAVLWQCFCRELRIRWENRLTLPHMTHVPGLDPLAAEIRERRQGVTTLGVNAENAAFWDAAVISRTAGNNPRVDQPADEFFPGDHHCLVGQKLQVYNLCVNIISATEKPQYPQLEKRPRLGEFDDSSRCLSSSEFDYNGDRLADASIRDRSAYWEMCSTGTGKHKGEDDEFADAMSDVAYITEDGATGMAPADVPMNLEDAIELAASSASNAHTPRSQTVQKRRKGACCPVNGSSLVANGDQLYAPYLQRPCPLTDDLIAERRMMLCRHDEPPRTTSREDGVSKQLEISYRLQKPKLLSDMCAFKAANPGSVFQDFIHWYGNPGNPLDDYSDGRPSSGGMADLHGRASSEPVAIKLDKANEAIRVLCMARDFWSTTWDEALPIPAAEQKPLFDASSTVEMAIDFMETMHPAILLNQIMAVNLSAAYFALVTAAKNAGVQKVGGHVQGVFLRLRERIERALELLAADATKSSSASCNDASDHAGSCSFVSTETLSSCEGACTALSEAEVLLSRSMSLLHKFPDQFNLVERILRQNAGDEIVLKDPKPKSQILGVIYQQQQQSKSAASAVTSARPDSKSESESIVPMPRPVLREYVLRNLDDSQPCQLSVRFGDEVAMLNKCNKTNGFDSRNDKNGGGGLILALSKGLHE